jgi:hypothetical protein
MKNSLIVNAPDYKPKFEVEVRSLTSASAEQRANFEEVKTQSNRETQSFTVSFVKKVRIARTQFDFVCAGSGILVCHGRYFAMLTAYHVAKELAGAPIGIVFSEKVSSFHLKPNEYCIVPVGIPSGADSDGPDLALIWILVPDKLGTIKANKIFYRLSDRDFEEWADKPLKEMLWWITGAPAEMAGQEDHVGGAVLRASHFAGEATWERFLNREDFEYVELNIHAGNNGYPADYEGVSGGGIWLAPIEETKVGFKHHPIVLAGVAYYQKLGANGNTVIIGHGPQSIYKKAAAVLADLKSHPPM